MYESESVHSYPQMMREVCKALQSLTDDATCKVVLISSATATFCNGLDYSTLQQQSSEKRRTAAEDLASGLRQVQRVFFMYIVFKY